MSQRKSSGSKMLSMLLLLIITFSFVASNTVLAATMPGLKAAVTEENIMAIFVRGYVQRNGRPLYSNWSNEIMVVVK